MKRILAAILFIASCIFLVFTYLNYQYYQIQSKNLKNSLNITIPEINIENFKSQYSSWLDRHILLTKVDDIFTSMSEDEKIGQVFMIGFSGSTFDNSIKSIIDEIHPGGFVFMRDNLPDNNTIKEFTDSVQVYSKIPLLLSTDEEGSPVNRLPWHSASGSVELISIMNTDAVAYGYGESKTKAFKLTGLNMNLAPVVDIASDNGFLNNRTLGYDRDKVSRLGGQIAKGQEDFGVISTLKHYPGIGSFTADPHNTIPTSNTDFQSLENWNLVPFTKNLGKSSAIMTSHVIYSDVDSEPVTFSRKFITELLKDKYGYNGLVITDDMNMASIDNYPDKYIKALKAGHDILLTLESKDEIKIAMNQIKEKLANGEIDQKEFDNKVKKIIETKLKFGIIK